MDLAQFGRVLLISGAVLMGIGLLLIVGDRIPFFGRLPGNIVLEGDSVTVFVPLGTMLLVSVLLTITVNVVIWLFNK